MPFASGMSRTPRYRLLALDVDGTLVNSHDQLTEATRGALLRASERGVRLVLATGRRYSRALPLVAPLAMRAPLVTASGALIKEPSTHETLFCAQFGLDLLSQWVRIVADAGYDPVLYADTFAHGYDFYCRGVWDVSAELADYLLQNRGSERIQPDLLENPPPGIFSGFAIGARAEMHVLADRLEAALPGQLYVHVLRSPRYVGFMCEIAPAGVSKWSGIRQLAAQWGIADEEICAVGDDVNDIPMIAAAGLGVAMGNALDEVKAAADRIAPTHDDDGLIQVVDWLLEAC